MTLVRALSNLMLDEQEKGPHVVLVGDNPAQGFIVYGPFPNFRDARDWLSRACDDNGWVQPLETPA